jgi:hypothetical protein
VPTTGGRSEDRVLLAVADDLERKAAELEDSPTVAVPPIGDYRFGCSPAVGVVRPKRCRARVVRARWWHPARYPGQSQSPPPGDYFHSTNFGTIWHIRREFPGISANHREDEALKTAERSKKCELFQ